MPYQYERTPFNTSQQVQMYQGCHGFASGGGAKDIGFNGMRWGESVYAVDGGTIVLIVRNSTCFSPRTSETTADPTRRTPADCGQANQVVIRGHDGFFTDYVHVLPSSNLTVGSTVSAGTLLGTIDNSAITNGPHIHLVRYKPNPNFDSNNPNISPYWNNGGTCNWTMFNVTGITPTPSNGWVQDEDSGNWYYFVNGVSQKGWVGPFNDGNWYYLDRSTGVWTGWKWNQANGVFR